MGAEEYIWVRKADWDRVRRGKNLSSRDGSVRILPGDNGADLSVSLYRPDSFASISKEYDTNNNNTLYYSVKVHCFVAHWYYGPIEVEAEFKFSEQTSGYIYLFIPENIFGNKYVVRWSQLSTSPTIYNNDDFTLKSEIKYCASIEQARTSAFIAKFTLNNQPLHFDLRKTTNGITSTCYKNLITLCNPILCNIPSGLLYNEEFGQLWSNFSGVPYGSYAVMSIPASTDAIFYHDYRNVGQSINFTFTSTAYTRPAGYIKTRSDMSVESYTFYSPEVWMGKTYHEQIVMTSPTDSTTLFFKEGRLVN